VSQLEKSTRRSRSAQHRFNARGLFLAILCTSAVAQKVSDTSAAAEGAANQLEEVLVTAQRRESNLQRTPVAVTALDSQFIEQISPRTIGDLAAFVPNFSASKVMGFNAAAFAMRGVGNTDIIVYNEAPIAVLVDDFVMPSVQTQLLDPFDVQEVEVLRGPQGTLFGKNTTGGAVVVRTKAPVLDDTTFEAQGEAGSFNALNLRGALNIPLIDNHLALRLVASEEREDGWMRNGSSDLVEGTRYTGDGARLGGTNVFTARAKLLWQPTDNLKTLFSYELLNDHSQSPGAVNVTPASIDPATGSPYFDFAQLGLSGHLTGNPLNQAGNDNRIGYLINMPDGHRVDANGYHLNVDWTLEPGTITWVQGYRAQDSALASSFTGVVGPISVFDGNRDDRRKTWQEEARFASAQDGAFSYVIGGFYQHDDTKFCVAQVLGIYDLFGVAPPAGLQPGGYNNNPQVLCNAQTEKSVAGFGEGNYRFTDATTLTIGARLTRDSKDWIGRQQVFVQQLPSATGAIVPSFTWQQLGGLMSAANFVKYPFGVVTDSHTWTQPTYRLTLSHQFDPSVFGYATFSHGFKAGGYNDNIGTNGNPIREVDKKPTDPEKANSFELGVKSELLDHRIRLNEALFYVKYEDAIRQIVVPVTNQNGSTGEEQLLRNAAKMTTYGIENELTAQLTQGLLLRLPLSYQHCKYNAFTTLNSAGTQTIDLSGLPVNRCPTWTATADLSYTLPVARTDGRMTFEVSANYISKNLDTYSITEPYQSYTQTYADGRTLLDASITYSGSNDRWFVRVLARNLTDRIYKIASQDVDPLWVWAMYGEPRYVAGQIGYKFGKK
jgi:iron complex outermembrane receptor protein